MGGLLLQRKMECIFEMKNVCKTKNRRRLGILFLLGSLFSLSVWAQAGVICGTVTDAKYKEPLIGASVVIEGTTIGAVTDVDGYFRIEKVEPGTYNVIASYVSYQSQTVKDVQVVAHQEAVLRIELAEADLALEGVTVVARKNMESENVLLGERQRATVSVENMGAKEMSIKGISNMADGVKKLTGISMVGNGQLFVRGLGDRYSLTTLNGLVVASPNPDNKLIPLELFPASAVKNITVSKVYQASTFGDYAGAHIDIGTKENTGADFFNVSFSFGGKSNAFFSDFYASDKNRVLGVKNLPQSLKDMTGREFTSYLQENRNPFGTNFDIRKNSSLPDMNLGIGFGKTWELGDGKLSLLGSGGFKTDSEIQEDSYEAVLTAQGNERSSFTSDDYRFQTQANALVTLGYQFANADMMNYTFFYSRLTEDIYKHRWGNTYDFDNLEGSNSIYHVYALMSHQLAGMHSLGEKWKLDWKGAYGTTSSDEPDRRQLMFRHASDGSLRLFTNDRNASLRYFGELDERVGTADLRLTRMLDEKNLIRFGAAYLDKDRDFYSTYFFYDFSRMPSSVTIDNVYDADRYVNEENLTSGYYTITKSREPKYCYYANSRIGSVFFESDFYPLGDRFLVNVGLRYEHAYQTVQYWNDGGNEQKAELTTDDFLPALNLKFDMTGEQAVRFSFSRTVTRPQFIEMAPFDYQESFGGASIRGNESLQNGYDYNVDLRYEYFAGNGDLYSVGAYYKYLDSPIERVQNVSGGYVFQTFMNANKGHAAGVEVELRKTLSPAWCFGLNAAYMFTRVSLPEEGVYTDKQRALQGASPFLGNADVTFTPELKGRRNLTLALLYNLQGPRIYTVGINGLGNVEEQTRHTLDFNANYALSDRVALKLQAKNLLSSTVRFKQTVVGTGEETEVERYKTQAGFEIGVSYKF